MSSDKGKDKEIHEKLVKKRPCKKCAWYNSKSYISCSHKCDYNHNGFEPASNSLDRYK